MERGTEWEARAVRRRWLEIERTRRAATRLLFGTGLFLGGLTLGLLVLVGEACISVGSQFPHGCTPVVHDASALGVLVLTPVAVAGGLWLCRSALRE